MKVNANNLENHEAKCSWSFFLLQVFNNQGIKVDPLKVDAVMNQNQSKTPTKTRYFLGLAGYYRNFIQDFSKIPTPFIELTRKNTKFIWGEKQEQEQEQTLQTSKGKLSQTPILVLP